MIEFQNEAIEALQRRLAEELGAAWSIIASSSTA
jgi:hypothetical protein